MISAYPTVAKAGKRPSWWHIHWWRNCEATGLNWYEDCRCGARRIVSASGLGGGYQPFDPTWVETGKFREPTPPTPPFLRKLDG